MPQSMLDLISNGNSSEHDQSGEFAVSGAVFAEAGLKWHGTLLQKKLRISIAPAWYLPLLYIPKSNLTYHLETENRLFVSIDGTMSVYTPFSFSTDPFSIGPLKDFGGFDVSLNGEYSLFPFLDVGGTLSRIPIVPSKLSNGQGITFAGDIINNENLFSGIGDIGSPEINTSDSLDTLWVVRPLRFDVYVLYRPFKKDLLIIKPSIGFTAINPSEEVYFNGILEAQLNVGTIANIGQIFHLYLNTGIEEGYWRHRLGFALNFRAVELDIEAGLKSQHYLKSYQVSGAEVSVGMKFGW
ncbi:hypothetical protein AGMMS49944_21580 [Spirochaetia bacterium]|nr:hypothetical protein AGMMS49944_21580 [Spirochaetia bacterium]